MVRFLNQFLLHNVFLLNFTAKPGLTLYFYEYNDRIFTLSLVDIVLFLINRRMKYLSLYKSSNDLFRLDFVKNLFD